MQALVDEHALLDCRRCLLVGDLDCTEGVITSDDIRQIPRRRWGATLVTDAVTPLKRVEVVTPDDGALRVLESLSSSGNDVLPVASSTAVVGAIEGSRVRDVGLARATAT